MSESAAPLCKCGQPLRYSNDTQCEDCWADAQHRYTGKSQRVNTVSIPPDEPFKPQASK